MKWEITIRRLKKNSPSRNRGCRGHCCNRTAIMRIIATKEDSDSEYRILMCERCAKKFALWHGAHYPTRQQDIGKDLIL